MATLETEISIDQPTQEPSTRKKVFDLAWPVISENFLQTMLGIVDTLLVGMLGAAAIAGVGAAVQLMFFVIAALSAVGIGSSVLVAQAVGAKEMRDARVLAKQSLVWSVIISIPLVITGLFAADWLMGLFGMEAEVTRIGADYLRVTMGTVVALALFFFGATRWLVRRTGGRFYSTTLINAIRPRSGGELLLVLLALVSAVMLEELLFRSLLLGGFAPVLPRWILLIGASIVFGLLHSPQGVWGMFGAALAGFFFGALFYWYGSLLAATIAHYVANAVQVVVAMRLEQPLLEPHAHRSAL